MSMKVPEGSQGDNVVRALLKAGLRVVESKAKTSSGHKIYQIIHDKTVFDKEFKVVGKANFKNITPQEAVTLLAARIAKLTAELELGKANKTDVSELEKEIRDAKDAHDLLHSGELDHHTWTDRAKEGAILVAASPFIVSMAILTGIGKTVLGTGALLNRGLFLAVDKAKAQLGDKQTREVELQAVKAYDNLRWGLLTKKGPPDYLAATETLYKRQSFIDGITKDSSFIQKAALNGPRSVKDYEAFAKIIAKKMDVYLQTGEFEPITESEWKKFEPDFTEFAKISEETNKYVKDKLIAQLDRAYQVYTPDPGKEEAFKDKLFELMGRKNNFLIFAMTAGFRATPKITAPTVNDELFSTGGIRSVLKHKMQKSLQGTSNQTLKESLAAGVSATAIIQLIERPGFVKRISKGLLTAVENSPLSLEGKKLVYQALFEQCTDDRGREKIFAKVGKEVAAQFIRSTLETFDISEEEKRHLVLLSLQTGDADLIEYTLGINITEVTGGSLLENETFKNLLSPPYMKSQEGQHPLFYALRSGNMRLTVAVAEGMKNYDGGTNNPYLLADDRGRKPIHYMTREQATWLDNHYLNEHAQPLDGTKPGSFSAVMDRLDALRFQGTNSRMVAGAVIGKMAGSAASAAVILATQAPGWTAVAQGPSTVKEMVASALEINVPVYGGLLSGAFITMPLQKAFNNLYVAINGLDLTLEQYEAHLTVNPDQVATEGLRSLKDRPESLGKKRNVLEAEDVTRVLKGVATLGVSEARRALSGLSKDWRMALRNRDPVAIAYLIQLSGDDITLSRNKLRQLANISYFPEVRDRNENKVDTRKLIGDFVLAQNEKRIAIAENTRNRKTLATANSQARDDIQHHFEMQIATGGKEYVTQAIRDWATSDATKKAAIESNGRTGIFITPMYKAAMATAIKMGDRELLADLRKLDAHITDDKLKPLFLAYVDKDGETLYHLAAMSRNPRMMMDVKEMLFLGRGNIEGTLKYDIEGEKQQTFYMSYGGIEMNPHALIARIRGQRSIDWNPDNLLDGKGRRIADIVDPDVAEQFDTLQRQTAGSQQTLSHIADTRFSRQLQKLGYTGLVGLPAGKMALYMSVANAIDAAVIGAGIAGFHAGGPALGFLAAYVTHVTTGAMVIGATVLLATAVGEAAEGAVAGLESVQKGYDNRTGLAYGGSAKEIQEGLKKAQELANLDPDIAKASKDAAEAILIKAFEESVAALGEEENLDPATLARIEKFAEISAKIIASHNTMGTTTRLLIEAAANLQLTPLQAKTLNDHLVERIGVYSGVVARKVAKISENELETSASQEKISDEFVGFVSDVVSNLWV